MKIRELRSPMEEILNRGLPSGHRVPTMGCAPTTVSEVEEALQIGYRHLVLDGSSNTGPEVSQLLRKKFETGALRREETFLTLKVTCGGGSRSSVKSSCMQTLYNLHCKNVDMLLLHRPVATKGAGFVVPDSKEHLLKNWKVAESLVDEGKVRFIGVSNYHTGEVEDVMTSCKCSPSVLMVEEKNAHSDLWQLATVRSYCRYRNMPLLVSVDLTNIAKSPISVVVSKLSQIYGRSREQILCKAIQQLGLTVVVESTNGLSNQRGLLTDSFKIFDWILHEDDISKLRAALLNY